MIKKLSTMMSKNYKYSIIYFLIIFEFIISGYLLNHHFSIVAGRFAGTDLCSVIFDKSCIAAVYSNFSVFLKIPVGGWGIIYMIVLLSLIIQSQIFEKSSTIEILKAAFWISFLGICFSLFYIVLMIVVPALFCPFCTIFHLFNFIIFFLIRKITNNTFSKLVVDFKNAFSVLFFAKPIHKEFNQWKWLSFMIPLLLGITVYQWSLLQGQNLKIDRLSEYDPLKEIERFESLEIIDIQFSNEDPVLGSKDAPVNLVIFSDFQCSMCSMFATNLKYLIKYNNEKLNIRFKNFPLSSNCNTITKENMHPLACNAARAGEAARIQGRFWEYHDSLFSQGTIKNEEQLFNVAKKMDIDMVRFKKDYESEACQQRINSDIQEGLRLKLDGTPSAFLNGRRLDKLSEKNINFLIKFISN
jgi:protein-disulfide isomerase/uncharacterized membrane protein